MEQTARAARLGSALLAATARQPQTPVGASYAFDATADGITSIYALRLLERGVDPRTLSADLRGARHHGITRGDETCAQRTPARRAHFGRAVHGRSTSAPTTTKSTHSRAAGGVDRLQLPVLGRSARLIGTACLISLLLLSLGIITARAQEAPRQGRYIVQAGDTLEAVAAEFGVAAEAILAASAVQNPPTLTAGEIIIIPAPWESPDEAVVTARQFVGTSPFVVAAHAVSPGDTLAKIANSYGLDAWSLAAFNGISDVDSLAVGQRLRVPLADSVSEPAAPAPSAAPEAVGGTATGWVSSVAQPRIAQDVPAYQQMYSLSCEYAAAFIATSAFGPGVPEAAFMERIGLSDNPHWGYRGDIHGPWGGTDDYGIYPEALAPTLNEFGFVADVFYGGGDPSALTARLDAGMPVITWLGYFGDVGWVQESEGSYLLVPGMHVVTVYGYDDYGVYLSNPGRGSYEQYAWDDFLAMWSVLDGMALGVAPM